MDAGRALARHDAAMSSPRPPSAGIAVTNASARRLCKQVRADAAERNTVFHVACEPEGLTAARLAQLLGSGAEPPSTSPRRACSGAWQDAFLANFAAFDALVLLREESLPQLALALSPSALERWAEELPAAASTAITDVLDEEVPQSKRARAIVSHIPRRAAQLDVAVCQ